MAPSRIDELRRRVQNDPASIAFAQLAEEYRRSGQTEEAVRVCREGLTRHPGYLSARVTLGRALLDLGQLGDAREELEFVVAEAPENLAAVRGLAEIFHREGLTADALNYYQRALALARHDPEIEEIVQQLSRQVGAAAAGPNGGLSFEEAHQELLTAAERLPLAPPHDAPPPLQSANEGSTAPFDFDRLVAALGTPAAPPQLEAAVAGRASTVSIDLPESTSLGPDPFAALEAELRANESLATPAKVAPWSAPEVDAEDAVADAVADALMAYPAEASTQSAAVAALVAEPETDPHAQTAAEAAEAATGDEAVAALPPVGADTEVAAVESSSAAALSDLVADPAVSLASEAVSEPVAEPTLVPVPEPMPVSEAPPDAELSVLAADLAAALPAEVADAPRPEASEGVLDELESWLTTLQDRSSQ